MTDADMSHHTNNALTRKNAGPLNKQVKKIRAIVKWAFDSPRDFYEPPSMNCPRDIRCRRLFCLEVQLSCQVEIAGRVVGNGLAKLFG